MRVLFGTTTVGTAGTRVQLSATADPVKKLHVQARAGNTGRMFLGKSDVSATVGGWEFPIPVATKMYPPLELDFGKGSVLLSLFYVDSTVNGEIVDWIAILE